MKVRFVIAEIFTKTSIKDANVLMLKEKEGERRVMLVISQYEAQGIASSLKDLEIERPLTHDLFESITTAFDINLKYIVINRAAHGTYYSHLCYERDGVERFIDARTSDAIAIALRVNVPMYIEEDLLEVCCIQNDTEGIYSIPVTFANNTTLKNALNRAIADEDYELAAHLKNEIKARRMFYDSSVDGENIEGDDFDENKYKN